MAVILISVQPELDAPAQDFLLAVAQRLEAEGHQPIIWSLFELTRLKPYALPCHWDLREWRALYRIPESCPDIEKAKWLARLQDYQRLHFVDTSAESLYTDLAAATRFIIETLRPAVFLCWAPLTPYFGLAWDLCKQMGISTYCLEWGYSKGYFLLDRGGLYGLSEYTGVSLEDLPGGLHEEDQASGEEWLQKLTTSPAARYTAGVGMKLPDGPSPRVLCLGTNDRAAGYVPKNHPDLRANLKANDSSIEAAEAVSKAHEGLTVYRPHPQMLEETPKIDTTTFSVRGEGSIDEWLDWADVVVTLGTNLEFIALARGKAVVSVVPTVLHGKQILFEASESGEMQTALQQALNVTDMSARRKRLSEVSGYLLRNALFNYMDAERTPKDSMRFAAMITSALNPTASAQPIDFASILKKDANVSTVWRYDPVWITSPYTCF